MDCKDKKTRNSRKGRQKQRYHPKMRSDIWLTTLLLGDGPAGVEGVSRLDDRFGVAAKTLPAQPFCGVDGFEGLPPTCFLNADVDGASLIGVPTAGAGELEWIVWGSSIDISFPLEVVPFIWETATDVRVLRGTGCPIIASAWAGSWKNTADCG